MNAARDLAATGTPGPWAVQDMGDETYTSENHRGWWWVWRAGIEHYAGVMEVSNYDEGPDKPVPGAVGHCEITDGRDGDAEREDAEKIVRAVNALPAIADLLDATDALPARFTHIAAARDAVAAALTGEES